MMAPAHPNTAASVKPRYPRTLAGRAEDLALALILGVMAGVPAAEVVVRTIFHTGLPGTAIVVQHLTLIVSMAGAAVAAREGRLLCLSTSTLLEGSGVEQVVRTATAALGAAACTCLAIAGAQFVLAERAYGGTLAFGIPTWWAQSVMPAGFTLIAIRLVLHGAPPGRWRIAAGSAAVLIVATFALWPLAPDAAFVPGLAVLIAATVLGTPVFVVLGGLGLLLFWSHDLPIASVALDHYRLVVNPSLPAIPLFTLAGYLLAESRAPSRLVRLFEALFGRFHGGAAVVTVVACTFFTSFTGASGVTVLALGGLLLPLLTSANVARQPALGLVTGAGSPGVLFAPSLPLILYAIVAQIPMDRMFLAGLVPASLMVAIAAGWGMSVTKKRRSAHKHMDRREICDAFADAKWELALPIVVFGAIFGGFATPVEAAAITALYVLVIETVVHRDLDVCADLPRIIATAGMIVGGILLILGVALGLTSFLVDLEIPERAVNAVTGLIESRWIFLLALNVILLAVGCLMDIFSAIVVVAPIVVPIGLAFGVDPIHLGIIFLANLELGYLTPPVGLNLFYAATRFEVNVMRVYAAVVPLFLRLAVGVLLITYVPWLSTALPSLAPG